MSKKTITEMEFINRLAELFLLIGSLIGITIVFVPWIRNRVVLDYITQTIPYKSTTPAYILSPILTFLFIFSILGYLIKVFFYQKRKFYMKDSIFLLSVGIILLIVAGIIMFLFGIKFAYIGVYLLFPFGLSFIVSGLLSLKK
jgi:hypothetical protein